MSLQKIYLIRHGETAWSLSGQHTGLTDIALTERGKQQALSLKQPLQAIPFTKVFVSPLQRAKETYRIIDLKAPQETDDDLCEWNYGQYEGLTSLQIHKDHPKWGVFTHGCPGGEMPPDVAIRADRIIQKALAEEGNVAFFSSGHILRSIAARWIGQDVVFGKHLPLQTATLSILGYEHDNRAICLWNAPI